jgi:hypothetical protein
VEPNETVTVFGDGYTGVRYKTYRTEVGKVGIRASWW